MVIQHNMNALNSLNRLSEATGRVKKASEKLASGYRINYAADDAAGLAISEKLRSQIRGLSQAVRNTQDGINYIQTGEGALTEIHSILQRGKELAAEAANGTYDNSTDRAALELEWKQLCSEVDHISETDFNGHQIFDIGDDVQRENPFGNESKSSLVMLKCTDGEYIPITITNESLDDTIASVVNTAGKGFTKAALEKFSKEIKDTYLPQVLNRIVSALPKSSKPTVSGMKIGYNLYDSNGNNDNVLASVSCSGGTHFQLNINVKHLEMNGSGGIDMTPQLAGTMTHEMVHAVMFDTLTNGMMGYNPAGGGGSGHDFPDWFVEGMAEAVAGGMSRLGMTTFADLFPRYNNSTSSDDFIKTTTLIPSNMEYKGNHLWEYSDQAFKNFAAGINGSDPLVPYTQGYTAVMFLGHLAGNNGVSGAAVNGNTIAQGLDKVLSEVAEGYSLDSVIKKYTGQNSTADFKKYFAAGGDDVVKFLKGLISASNVRTELVNSGPYITTSLPSTNGAGALGTPTKLTGSLNDLLSGGNNDFFTLDLDSTMVDNSTIMQGSGNGIKEGGSTIANGADRNGKTPTSGPDPINPNPPGPDPDPPGPGPDPDNPNPPGPDNPNPSGPDNPGKDTSGLEPTAITLQIGARTKDIVKFALTYDCDAVGDLKCDFNCSAKGLGISALTLANQKDANDAVDKIDFAINKTSMMRTVFGAAQNRLEHKTLNLETAKENLTASESSIRDTDVASEMLGFTKFNILQQAAQSMMVQANQLPQGVLQLLQ